MTRAIRGAVLAVAVAATWPQAGRAQDPCPSASGPDAEAGWSAYAEGDIEVARRHFEAALARCDNDQYARTGLGYVALRDGDTTTAERSWTTVLVSEPNNVDALVGLGLARWRAGDVDAVRARFERVLQLAPEHPTAVEYLERLSRSGTRPDEPDDPADGAWRAGDTALAMRLYRQRLAERPDDPGALLRVGLMTAWQEEYTAALELLDRLLESQPRHLDARLARARVLAWSGDLAGARAEVVRILEVQPDNSDALEALALFQAWAGDFEEALDSYDELVSISGGDGAAGRQQAQALAWASEFEASRAAYDALIERNPDDVEARLGLARTLAFSQRFTEAIAEYDEVLDRAPDDERALLGKARTLGWAGDLVGSERVALSALAADGSSAAAWGGLGQVYRWQGRLAAARGALERAAELAPTNAEVRDQLRSVDLALAPVARPRVRHESDSDENRMITTTLVAGWHPVPRLDLRAEVYYKDLEQGAVLRTAQGLTLTGDYEVDPGWSLSATLGGSRTDGAGDTGLLEYRAAVSTPARHALRGTVSFSSSALNETALLAELETRSTELSTALRWIPARRWRVDGSVGLGSYRASEANGRRSASLSASRRIGRFFSLGASMRGFSFEKNLQDGYFDPDFYGIAELTSYWLYRPAAWTLLVEVAPGVQQVRSDGPASASVRTNTRVAYRLAPGREVSLGFAYSSAGLVSFASNSGDYGYTAFTLGTNWTF